MEHEIINAYTQARKRLFLLDYDGTLTDIRRLPHEAVPDNSLLDLLRRLAGHPGNTVVIISGRNHADLDAWLGDLPLSFVAEHGLLYKTPDKPWYAAQDIDDTWKTVIRRRMQHYTDAVAGTFIEEKTNGLVWHYRTAASQANANKAKKLLMADIRPLAEKNGLRIMQGAKIVEIQPQGVSKGSGAVYWLTQGDWDFVLTAGDDVTDEDMFTAVPLAAFTAKIGSGDTVARIRLDTPADMRRLLAGLV